MKEFVYLYPIPEYTDSVCPPTDSKRRKYKEVLNQTIDVRYRQQGFGINYVIFDSHQMSEVVDLKPSDRVIKAGIDFKTHTTRKPNGEYPYPNPDNILDQLEGLRILRVAGFHMWDCVERLAKRAHEKEMDVLVDEDLTEFLPYHLNDSDFKIDTYPTYNPHKVSPALFELFMEARQNKPWLWQNY